MELKRPDLRRTPRFPFVAAAELTCDESEERLECQVGELGLNGCYVDMLNTLPVNSIVNIKIMAGSECFAASAKVVYALENLGMGLAFQDVSIQSGVLLRKWLDEASKAAK